MRTDVLTPTEENLSLAAEKIRAGEVVAFPTETVYGLGANALEPDAVKKIFNAKGRPADNPLIVHISRVDDIEKVASYVPDIAYKLAEKFWPGPLTIILPKSEDVPKITSGGLDTVGIRFPSNPVARRFIELCGVPIAAPSANLSGSPSPTTAKRVFEDMNGRIPVIIDGGECKFGVESTVISIDRSTVKILRPGAVTDEMLLEVVDSVIIDGGVLHEIPSGQKALSPGMKYKHYSPKADVTLVKGSYEAYSEYVKNNPKDGLFCLIFDEDEAVDGVPYVTYGKDSETQAHRLFEALRELDERGARFVYARSPESTGIGLAVFNRILRAAGFKIVEAENE